MNKELLTKEEIVCIREELCISQKGLDLLLGFEEGTIEEIENGSIQNENQDDILRSIKEYENFKVYWNTNKSKLSIEEQHIVDFGYIDNHEDYFNFEAFFKKYEGCSFDFENFRKKYF